MGNFLMAGTTAGLISEGESAPTLAAWTHALLLVCQLTVDLPLPGFTVADMLRLQPGSMIHAHWSVGADVPLQVNGTLLAHGEFEVAGERLAIRLTELM